MLKKLFHIHSLGMAAIAVVFLFGACTIQVNPDNNQSAKKANPQSFDIKLGKKKSQKRLEKQIETTVKEPGEKEKRDDSVQIGDTVFACYFDPNLFSGQFGEARLLTIAGEQTKGEYQVEWKWNSHATAPGKKSWLKAVILKYHTAKLEELKPGMVVLYGSANNSRLNVVKDVLAYKNMVVLEYFIEPGSPVYSQTVDISGVRVIDQASPQVISKDPRVKQ